MKQVIFLFLFFVLCSEVLAIPCLPRANRVIEVNRDQDYAFEVSNWDSSIAESRFSETDISQMQYYPVFRDMITNFFGGSIPAARDIITNQRAVFVRYQGEDNVYSHNLVLNGKIGQIRQASCLDVYLMDRHLSYRELTPMYIHAEFRAIALSKQNEYKVYFFSSLITGGMAPSIEKAESRIEKDLEQGWKVIRDIHNHPFSITEGRFEPGGSLVPSGCDRVDNCGQIADVGTFKRNHNRWGLRIGNITNGFETIDISVPELFNL